MAKGGDPKSQNSRIAVFEKSILWLHNKCSKLRQIFEISYVRTDMTQIKHLKDAIYNKEQKNNKQQRGKGSAGRKRWPG